MSWDNVRKKSLETFRNYCKHSSLHGFYYFSESRHWSVYFIWISIILSSLALCAFLSHMIWEKFAIDPTFTVVESTHFSTSNVPFPEVIVCDSEKVYGPNTYNITNILEHRNFEAKEIEAFYNSFKVILDNDYNPPEVVKKMHKTLDDLGFHYNELIKILAKPCEVLIVECEWRSELHDCVKMFRMVYTVAGYCCQFDMTFFKTYADPRTNFVSGKELTEALGIVVNGQKITYDNNVTDSHALMYVYNDKNRLTIIDSPTTLTAGGTFDTKINIWVIDSSKDVKTLSLYDRKCLLETDNVDTGRFYQECMSILILKKVVSYCRCLPFHYTNEKLNVEDLLPCTWDRLACIHQTIGKVKSNIRDIVTQNECLQNCDDIQYETEIEYVKNVRRDEEHNKSFSHVVVHFDSNTCLKYRREVLYAWDQMVANLGGIFGLCLGGSIISIIELIWFLFDFIISAFISYKTENPKLLKNKVFDITRKDVQKKKIKNNASNKFGKYPYLD